jgi:hypothetical protein
MTQKSNQPRWRKSRFGDNWELVQRRPGGGPAIWYGSVEPVIGGTCRYSTPHGSGGASTQDDAKQVVEQIAAQHPFI